MMKLLYCSDLHGSEAHYARLVDLALDRRPSVLVLGGDLLPDDSALDPARMGHGQPEFVHRQFRQFAATLRESRDLRSVLVIFGNHDWRSSASAMRELADDGLVTILDHTKAVEIDGLSFLGYSYTPPTPWFVKDFERLDQASDQPPLLGGARWDERFSRSSAHSADHLFAGATTIADDMAELKVPAGPWVFVAHAPPFGSDLDRTQGQKALGSRAIRAAIEKYQPVLSLHGHIHESPEVTGEFRQNINKTVAINPGQRRCALDYAEIQIDVAKGKVTEVQHGQSFTGV